MLTRTGWLLLALVGVAQAQPAPLDERTFKTYRDYILPSKDELEFEQIPWRPAFWEAVVEAQAKDRPMLVWAMNGHPLACT